MSQVLTEEQITKWMESMKGSPGFSSVTYYTTDPSDVELRIRKEVHNTIGLLLTDLYKNETFNKAYHIELTIKIRDCLILLWGDK